MPIYEYECNGCGHQFELIQKLSDPLRRKCPSCLKNRARRVVSAPGFRLKGKGFYAPTGEDNE